MSSTIFTQIIDRTIPANIRYEDELCIAFDDINPKANTHILIVPKKPIPMLVNCDHSDQALLGHCLLVANKLAEKFKLQDNFKLGLNNGEKAGQEVFHLHFHFLSNQPSQ